MEPCRFDSLTRSLTVAGSRRAALGSLLVGTLGLLGLLSAHGDDGAAHDALLKCKKLKGDRKQKCVKKAKKHNALDAAKVAPPPPPPSPLPSPQSPLPPPSCPQGTTVCGSTCVIVATDPLNCGSCGQRCQINAVCAAGTCRCVIDACGNPDRSCCPLSPVGPTCSCQGGGFFVDPTSCAAVTDCPPGSVECVGPQCQACCPSGSTCDTSTGTCLQ